MMQAEDIKDERCKCGHLQSEHKPAVYLTAEIVPPLAIDGHGPCSKCDCRKYTFVNWVGKDGKDIEI